MEEGKRLAYTERDLQQCLNLGGLALGLNLKEEIINKFIIYLKMINSYQEKVNITSIKDPFDIISKHFLDSLSSLYIIDELFSDFKQGMGLKVIDVGSGAGLPGIPIKIVLPHSNMTLLEAKKNKTLFLMNVINKLALADIEVLQDRVENIGKAAEYRENYHIVLSRAVAALNILCELCLPLCQINGVMIAFKGSSYSEELSMSSKVIERLGGTVESVNTIRIPYSNHLRYLLVIRKIKPTPEDYPRKTGVPQKRPLYFK
ncbi:MAG: 16S rRNA (guanine(527)-N(7))-methyltransferase RsmG [Atribacterota bacterium]|nr:16S rRNA (guanine(527)-N(7))-methyltransferase RsmG [Atribacterota bacterium]